MACYTDGKLSVCYAGEREIIRHIIYCPTCKRRRRMVEVRPDSPWYSPRVTCCGCGDGWMDGEMLERPFLRGWRQAEIRKAREQWNRAFRMTPEQYEKWWKQWTA